MPPLFVMFKCGDFSDGDMFVDSQGDPQQGAQVGQPARPQTMPHPSPAAQPASPQPKKEGAEKEKPKETEKPISMRPNFLLCALFQALNLAVLVAIIVVVLALVGIDFQEDIIGVMTAVLNELAAASEESGGIPLLGALLGQLRDTLVFAFIQVMVVGLILQIPVVNNHWKLFSDRLEYKKGFILLRTKTIPFSDVKEVTFKKYTSLADFGKVTVEYSGGEGKTITMPYVFHAERLTGELNARVKQYQMSKVASLAKNSQPAQPGAPPQGMVQQQ